MKTFAVAAVSAVVLLAGLPAQAQYYGMSGYSFNNPLSASIDTMLFTGMQSRMVYRTMLKKRGYTDAQLGQMSTDEMVRILKGGAASAPAAKAAPVPAPAAKPVAMLGASKFKPAKKRLLLDALADSMVEDKEQQAALREVFAQGMAAYEKEAAKEGFANDIAGASAFFIGTAYFVLHDGREPDEDGLTLAAKQLQVMFDTPEMKKQPDAEKQKFYELLVGLSTWLGVTYQLAAESQDQQLLAQLKTTAHDALQGYLKIDPAKLNITANGMEIAK